MQRELSARDGLLGKILPLGISSLLTQLSIVIIMGVMNTTLVKYGALSEYGADIPMTVVGIVMKVFQIVIAFVVGITAGCQPIVGYNYGAGNGQRVRQIFKTMMLARLWSVWCPCWPFSFFRCRLSLYLAARVTYTTSLQPMPSGLSLHHPAVLYP